MTLFIFEKTEKETYNICVLIQMTEHIVRDSSYYWYVFVFDLCNFF